MQKINGYLLDTRVAEMLQRVEFLPHYVMLEFKKHFSSDAVLAAWIQYYTFLEIRKKHNHGYSDYITYMFEKCCQYDKKSDRLELRKVYVMCDNWVVDIEEKIF